MRRLFLINLTRQKWRIPTLHTSSIALRTQSDVNPLPLPNAAPTASFHAIYFFAGLADYFPEIATLDSEFEKHARRQSGEFSQVALKTLQLIKKMPVTLNS